MYSDNTTNFPLGLRAVKQELKDTEGNIVQLDAQYELTNGCINDCIDYLKTIYKDELLLVPIGGLSAGGRIFNLEKKTNNLKVVGLTLVPPTALSEANNICYTLSESDPDQSLKTQELHINTKKSTVYVGAAVVLEQINASVQHALGKNYSVLGTDLTSSGYATAGATFMTGGMGPSRIHFAKNIISIKLHNGECEKAITEKDKLENHMETYGWTGMVSSITLPIIETPTTTFGFALPINNSAAELAVLANYFATKTKLEIKNNKLEINEAVITGIEILTENTLEMLANIYPNMPGLENILSKILNTNKNALVFITGLADENPFQNINDPLGIFKENVQTGLALEQAIPFENLQQIKQIREGAPDEARRQFGDYPFSYKNHTDINIKLNMDNISASMQAVWACYERYEQNLRLLFKTENELIGELNIYGHLNPQGIDPHYRITIASENEQVLNKAKQTAQEYYNSLVVDLNTACINTGSKMTGGEKGIISNIKIIEALKINNINIPEDLQIAFAKQKETINQSNTLFNWRNKLK